MKKFMLKRIAAVAVSALSAGLLSVVAVPQASGATGVLVGSVYENITNNGAAVVSATTGSNGSYGILSIGAADGSGNQTVLVEPNAIVVTRIVSAQNSPSSITVSASGLMSKQAGAGNAQCFKTQSGGNPALTQAADLLSCSLAAAGGTDTGTIFAATRAIGTSYTITLDSDTGTAGNSGVITVVVSNAHQNAANGGAAATDANAPVSNGVIANNFLSNPGALLQGVTMYATGALTVATSESAIAAGGAGTVAQRISVSGGLVSAAAKAGVTGGTMTIAADKSRVDLAASATDTHTAELQAVITPNSGVTRMTISGWNTYTASASPNWIITVTIASASAVGVATVADSSVAFVATETAAATADVAGANAVSSRAPLFLNAQLNDVYGNDVSAGGLVVEVSSGAIVGIGAASNGAPGALSTATHSAIAISTANPTNINIRVQEATAGRGWNGTIKVTWNGLVIATKSGSILGDIAKITITAAKIASNATANTTDALEYQAYDAANNIVALAHGSVVLSSSSEAGIVSGITGTSTNSTTTTGKATVSCASGAVGKSSVVVQTTLAATGAVIKSNAADFTCAGNAVAYRASLDKASYAQGEIATLTVQFLDSRGNPANSVGAVTSAGPDSVISASQMERVTAYTASQTPDGNGQRKFTFTVGTSSGVVAGKYNMVVSFPTLNTVGTNQSVAYEVTAPKTVSFTEVLASVVKLIGTINKQIRALQKSLRR